MTIKSDHLGWLTDGRILLPADGKTWNKKRADLILRLYQFQTIAWKFDPPPLPPSLPPLLPTPHRPSPTPISL